ncbi:iron-containing alcohol dehydrogenase [Novosphingobium sp. AAP83]|uniref:iron-containing alcohol dehydrogenase n=1 Tax=Novosphingobium sp. AAP83 TaxID=1523425 RepID=UPI00350FBCA0
MVQCGLKRPFVVTDSFLLQSGMAAQLVGLLEAAGMPVQVFAETVPDPNLGRGRTSAGGLALERQRLCDRL